MSDTGLDKNSLLELVTDFLRHPDFRRATFGGAVRGQAPSPWVRVVVRPVMVRGRRQLQFSYFDERKDISKNFNKDEAVSRLREIVDLGFAGIHLSAGLDEVDVRTTKKGKIIVGRRKIEPAATKSPAQHNRAKDLPLPEGQADRVLEVMGILTQTGQVRPTMRAKFTQINEFLNQLRVVVDQAGLQKLDRPVEILDCGCGSSYLTLAAHHFLNDVLDVPARIIGVDVDEEVIRKSVERSAQLGADGVAFACRPIEAVDAKPDIVLALHACDTATDDAIARAITFQAQALLSVPCCHHNLNAAFRDAGPTEALRPLYRHGLLRERTADLVTDAFRALALRICGYRTEIVEFVSREHTARNLMIRAIRGAPAGETAFVNEYREMRRFWGVTPYLEHALDERFQALLNQPALEAP